MVFPLLHLTKLNGNNSPRQIYCQDKSEVHACMNKYTNEAVKDLFWQESKG